MLPKVVIHVCIVYACGECMRGGREGALGVMFGRRIAIQMFIFSLDGAVWCTLLVKR